MTRHIGTPPCVVTRCARRPRARSLQRLRRDAPVTIAIALPSVSANAHTTAVELARRMTGRRRRAGPRRLPKTPESAAVVMDASGRRRHVRRAPEEATAEPAWHRQWHRRRHIGPQRRFATRNGIAARHVAVVVVVVGCRRDRRHGITALFGEGSGPISHCIDQRRFGSDAAHVSRGRVRRRQDPPFGCFGCTRKTHLRRRCGVSVMTFVPRYLHGGSAKSEICGDREIRTEENRRTNRRSACELGIVPASRTYPGRSVGRSGRPTSPVGRCS